MSRFFFDTPLAADADLRTSPYAESTHAEAPIVGPLSALDREIGVEAVNLALWARRLAIHDRGSFLLWKPALPITVLNHRPLCGQFELSSAGGGWVRATPRDGGAPSRGDSNLLTDASPTDGRLRLHSRALAPTRTDEGDSNVDAANSRVDLSNLRPLQRRRPNSQRVWSSPTDYRELACLLLALVGGEGHTPGFPSAGGIYNYSVHLLAFHVDGLSRGLWHLSGRTLEQVPLREDRVFAMEAQVRAFLVAPGTLVGALVLLTSDLVAQTDKYGAYAHDFALASAGAFLSSAYWLSADTSLGVCPTGGLDLDPLADALSLHRNTHLASLCIGSNHGR